MRKIFAAIFILSAGTFLGCGIGTGSSGIEAQYRGLWKITGGSYRGSATYQVVGSSNAYNFDDSGCIPLGGILVDNGIPSFDGQKYKVTDSGMQVGSFLTLNKPDKAEFSASFTYIKAEQADGYFSNPVSLIKDFCCPSINPKPADCK